MDIDVLIIKIDGLTVWAGSRPAAGSRPDIASPVALGEKMRVSHGK